MSFKRTSSLILVAALVTASLAAPSLASPNDGRYQKSAEAFRKTLSAAPSFCHDLKTALDYDEREADKRAGTKEAKVFADEANWLYEQGVKFGCSWAT